MDFQLITELPSWLILPCIALGLLYAWLLYRKDETFQPVAKWFMAIFRFLAVTILAILLLSPLIRTIFREVEKPLIIFLQDNSESLISIADSANFRKNYPGQLNRLRNSLKDDFEIRSFSFGDKVTETNTMTFTEKQTEISAAASEINSRFSGRNIGAVILASDGLFNKGSNPSYAFPALKVPVYTIALGDTVVRKDLLISSVRHNKSAFLGNTFPAEIIVDARQGSGEKSTLSISRDNKILYSQVIEINTSRFNKVVPVFLEADVKGINHYVVTLSGLDGELSLKNNVRDFFVEVNDNRQKIEIISGAPHPDLGMIRNILESNPNYEVKITNANEFGGNFTETNLVIFHQVPSLTIPGTALLDRVQQNGIPVLFILGGRTSVNLFNKLNTGVKISDSRSNLNEVQAQPSVDFTLFTMEEEHLKRIGGFPPLIAPFGNYEATGEIYPLLFQKVGPVSTGMPLLFFSQFENRKTGVLCGEGIWKWALREYVENNNKDAVTALLMKSVQYLASREKKTPFRILHKNSYQENEQLILDAELYNESGELVNSSDVKIILKDENGRNFPYTFSKTGKAFTLNAGYLPVGKYEFTASTRLGNKQYSESGSFTISALQLELSETIANHQLLNTLSSSTGGSMVYPSNLDDLDKLIRTKEDIKPVSYSQKKLSDVISLKWIFVLIMAFLSFEWFIRKRSGSY